MNKLGKSIYNSRIKIGCTTCEYCMPCTVDINIPKIFSLWNNAHLYNEHEKSSKLYKEYLEDGVSATECIECHKCENICPQFLEIIDGLQQAHADLTA